MSTQIVNLKNPQAFVDVQSRVTSLQSQVNSLPLAIGPQGSVGNLGLMGLQGTAGFGQGPQGLMGPTGSSDGLMGSQGLVGFLGNQGNQGNQGISQTGSNGSQGFIGPLNDSVGSQGLLGPQGTQGPLGSSGITGLMGPTGPEETIGSQGSQGPVGFKTSAYLLSLQLDGTNNYLIPTVISSLNPSNITISQGSNGTKSFIVQKTGSVISKIWVDIEMISSDLAPNPQLGPNYPLTVTRNSDTQYTISTTGTDTSVFYAGLRIGFSY
jgi:hypothetical protein